MVNILCQLLSIQFAFLQLFQLNRQKESVCSPQGKASPSNESMIVGGGLEKGAGQDRLPGEEYNFLAPDVTMNTH